MRTKRIFKTEKDARRFVGYIWLGLAPARNVELLREHVKLATLSEEDMKLALEAIKEYE